jgi:enoyl-CoA hydratase/carnithine racemase
MIQMHRTLHVTESEKGVLGVVIDTPPRNLVGPELVRDLVTLIGELESDQKARILVLESADPE